MAKACPDEHERPDYSRRIISVLLLGTRWQFDTCGISTINKSLIKNLRSVDPKGKTIKITCAVQQEEGKIKDEDLKDAEKYGVELDGVKWLDEDAPKYYPHLDYDKSYDFIIGHAPYMVNRCLTLKQFYRNKQESPKVILIFHALPKDVQGDIGDDLLFNWLCEADVVFSIGKPVENELLPYIAALEPEKRPTHNLYLPSIPLEFFLQKRDTVQEKVRGTQHIYMMCGDVQQSDNADMDLPVAVTSVALASQHLRDFDGVRLRLSLLVANEDEKIQWKEQLEEVLRIQNLNDTGLRFQVETPKSIEQMEVHLRRSNLFLLPLKQNSPFFGTEALAAIAAGVPILASKYSGLASLLDTVMEDEPIVGKNMLKVNIQSWKERIIQKLVKPAEAQKAAIRLRERLLMDTSIAKTHLNFSSIIAGRKKLNTKLNNNTKNNI